MVLGILFHIKTLCQHIKQSICLNGPDVRNFLVRINELPRFLHVYMCIRKHHTEFEMKI